MVLYSTHRFLKTNILRLSKLGQFNWILFCRYVDDLATIYHPERKSMLSSIEGFSLTIECLGGEVPFFYLSGKYTLVKLCIVIIHITKI